MTTLTKADWGTLEAELPEDGLVTDPIELITYEVDGGLNRGAIPITAAVGTVGAKAVKG